MGIRINICLGWGFPKVKQNDPRFTAEFLKRWNDGEADLLPEFRSAVVKAKKEATPATGEYNRDQGDAEMLLQRIDAKNWFDKKEPIKHLYFYEAMRQSGFAYEGRRVSPLIFVPIEHDDWSRHVAGVAALVGRREPQLAHPLQPQGVHPRTRSDSDRERPQDHRQPDTRRREGLRHREVGTVVRPTEVFHQSVSRK